MARIARVIILLTVTFSGTSFAQQLPDYYPESFQRTGTVDDISSERIVINDVPYTLTASTLVHTLYAEETVIAAIQPRTTVGYRIGENREIIEIWELPNNYDRSRSRR